MSVLGKYFGESWMKRREHAEGGKKQYLALLNGGGKVVFADPVEGLGPGVVTGKGVVVARIGAVDGEMDLVDWEDRDLEALDQYDDAKVIEHLCKAGLDINPESCRGNVGPLDAFLVRVLDDMKQREFDNGDMCVRGKMGWPFVSVIIPKALDVSPVEGGTYLVIGTVREKEVDDMKYIDIRAGAMYADQ